MANKRETIFKLDLRLEARLHWFLARTEKATMQVIHLSQKGLAERWRMSEATLERWRSDRIGPVFLKIRGRVLYRLIDIETFEVASLKGTFVVVFGSDGRALSPFHSTKKGERSYRYYIPQRDVKEYAGASGLPRMPAAELESALLG